MLIERRLDRHFSIDFDPGGLVDVHRHRWPAAEQVPDWPYVNR